MSWQSILEQVNEHSINLNLDRVREVASHLKILKFSNTKIITIAGTNGKGSTVYALEAILLDKDLSVGSYTSPHIHSFYERIRVNSQEIEDVDLDSIFSKIYQISQDLNIQLSYFEFATLAALYHFKQKKLDIILLEVGMGGRLDATNIVDSDIAIITSIGLDHTDYLGHSLQEIAFEKSAISRAGKPCIVAQKLTDDLLEIVNKAGGNVTVLDTQNYLDTGSFLASHIATVDKVCRLLHINISKKSIYSLLEKIVIKGRMQHVFYKGKEIILDGAHNIDAFHMLRYKIVSSKENKKIICVLGMMRDKNILACMNALEDIVLHWVFCSMACDRAASAEYLAKNATKPYNLCNSITEGLDIAMSIEQNASIVVTGSFYALNLREQDA